MEDFVINFELRRKAAVADKWWNDLPEITKVAIWEDLKGIENAPI